MSAKKIRKLLEKQIAVLKEKNSSQQETISSLRGEIDQLERVVAVTQTLLEKQMISRPGNRKLDKVFIGYPFSTAISNV